MISYFWEIEISSFLIIEEISYSSASFFFFLEISSFQNIWGKYHISMYFFEKDHLSFSI